GGTIHDVAQVVGAGFSVSTEAGETATLVKLIRVAMLAPVVLLFAIASRRVTEAGSVLPDGGAGAARRPPLLPGFVLAFLALAAVNSFGFIPAVLAGLGADLSQWALVTGIVAVGMKTSLGRILEVGGDAVALIIAETVFIGLFILAGLYLSGHIG